MNPLHLLPLLCITLLLNACITGEPDAVADLPPTFGPAKTVLQVNCVHCHGDQRLSGMPSIASTHSLAKLIGPGNWIIPGQPDQSRFFQVVIFPDEIPNAMPPTGHAISAAEVATLRAWITAGAPLPAGRDIVLHPQGEAPRSR
jgi:mono/diheme cytochrome c family protein